MAEQIIRLHAENGYVLELIPRIPNSNYLKCIDLRTNETMSIEVSDQELVQFCHLVIKQLGN